MGIVGFIYLMSTARFSRLVGMSIYFDERSCSGVGPGGRLVSKIYSIACHLVAMGVSRGSWVEELCVRLFKLSGDSACRSLQK